MNPCSQTKLMSLIILLASMKAEGAEAATAIARRGCKDTCGDVRIPFPWGSGSSCFLDHWFEIECREIGSSYHSNTTKLPFLAKLGVEVFDLDVDGGLGIKMPPVNICTTSDTYHKQPGSLDLRGSPYSFSDYYNSFILEGCSGIATVSDQHNNTVAGCATICQNRSTVIMESNNCYGANCCQSSLPYSFQFYQLDIFRQSIGSLSRQNCLLATLVMLDYGQGGRRPQLLDFDASGATPVALRWNWINSTKPDFNQHATCDFGQDSYAVGYSWTCSCKDDSTGSNPYVYGGCRVADECMNCSGVCSKDIEDSSRYNCVEPPRFHLTLTAILSLSIGLGVVMFVIGCYGTYRSVKKRRDIEKRANFFKRNGGLLLEQQTSSNKGIIETTKIFTTNELEKATDHFSENRMLGQGGQGAVYKGMLSDGRIVAVKKSKLLDENQLQQFINEVVILSQLNHRHVVKILGCCLETEVPLLVYEFVPNGTLFQHIHGRDEDVVISWAMRLKVALQSAGAIAYLHSFSSTPIFHRDIKSSNILLDDKNRAKVSDFGSSKTIAIDQTHLTTLVQGTMGYLDPEYFQSYQFTEKSDVYSFGVVLLELLTSRKPIYRDENMEQKNLVIEFLFLMENSRLLEIIDSEVVKEAKEEELMVVANLTKRCLSWMGKMRPTMKEVAMALENIIYPPTEISAEDQQAYPHEGFSEFTSDVEFMSSPLPAGGGSPFFNDVQPLLHDTI